MKRNSIVILLLIALSIPCFGQTESAQKVSLEVNKLKLSLPLKDVVKFLEERKTSFDFNNRLDQFLYNLQMGVMNYNLERYQKAYPYLLTTTQICDAESAEVFAPQNDFLATYYWLAVCALNIGESREQILTKLNRAKQVFIQSQLTGTPLYQTILNDIKLIEGDYYTFIRCASEGVTLSMQGKYAEAIPRLKKALSIFPDSKNFIEKANFIDGLAKCYFQTGQLQEAENLYLNTINELSDLNAQNEKVYWNLCDGLGIVYMQLHNFKKALHYSSTAKRLHEQYLDFDDGYIRCLSNCAIIELQLGQKALAKMFIDVALKQMRTNYIGYDNSINKLFSFVQENDILNNNGVKSEVDKNLKIKPLITFLSNAAIIYSSTGYIGDAISCIKESITLSKEINEEDPKVINNLGILYMQQNKLEQADSCFNEAYKSANSFYEIDQVAHNLALTKWLLEKKDAGDFSAEVSNHIKNNLSFNFSYLTNEEKDDYWSYLELYLPVLNLIMYESGIDKLKQDIFDNIIFEKGLLLRSSNSVRDAILSSGNQVLINKFNQMLIDQQRLLKEKDQKQQVLIKNRIESAEKFLVNQTQTYDKSHSKCTWEDVKKKLTRNEIAIEFYNIPYFNRSKGIQHIDGEPRVCAIILKAGYNTPHIIPLCLESKLEDKNSEKLQDLQELYKLIWEPLAKELKDVDRIFFSPYRTLHTMPIEYLVDENGISINEKYEIYRLSSSRILTENSLQRNEFKNVSLYGGLSYDLAPDEFITASTTTNHRKLQANRAPDIEKIGYGVKYLPGTRFEVNMIFDLFKKHKITPKLYCELDGTEESFKNLSGVPLDILHISTHGFYWSDEEIEDKKDIPFLNYIPLKHQSMNHTGLFMTGANIALKGLEIPYDIEDGILTAQEISSLNLGNIDLVVLSACQTGLGDIYNDAVYGLQRGFKLAGANSLLVSLWKVDDKATMLLMTEFYKQLLNGKGKVESLKMAQKCVQNKYGLEHPEYWAGFVLLDALN